MSAESWIVGCFLLSTISWTAPFGTDLATDIEHASKSTQKLLACCQEFRAGGFCHSSAMAYVHAQPPKSLSVC